MGILMVSPGLTMSLSPPPPSPSPLPPPFPFCHYLSILLHFLLPLPPSFLHSLHSLHFLPVTISSFHSLSPPSFLTIMKTETQTRRSLCWRNLIRIMETVYCNWETNY